MPALEHAMEIGSRHGDFPFEILTDGAGGFGRIETEVTAIRRPGEVEDVALDAGDLARFGAVEIGDEEIPEIGVCHSFAIGRPAGGFGDDVSEPARRSAQNADTPERALGRRALAVDGKHLRSIRRQIDGSHVDRGHDGKLLGLAARGGELSDAVKGKTAGPHFSEREIDPRAVIADDRLLLAVVRELNVIGDLGKWRSLHEEITPEPPVTSKTASAAAIVRHRAEGRCRVSF